MFRTPHVKIVVYTQSNALTIEYKMMLGADWTERCPIEEGKANPRGLSSVMTN